MKHNPFRDVDYEELIKDRDYYKGLAEARDQDLNEEAIAKDELEREISELRDHFKDHVPRTTPVCPSCKTRDVISLSNGYYTTYCAYCASNLIQL